MKLLCAVLLVLPAVPLEADQIFLQGGGEVTGVIVSRTDRNVTVEVAPGTITLPASRIERIVEGSSPLSVFRQRAGSLAPTDVTGLMALGRWASSQGLDTQARECFARVLAVDPGNEAAHNALGEVHFGGRWMTAEESFRAQGLVPFEGSWITPAERAALERDRQAADAGRAEAEARIAEARAREAAAAAAGADQEQTADDTAPVTPIWGVTCVGCRIPHPRTHVRRTPVTGVTRKGVPERPRHPAAS